MTKTTTQEHASEIERAHNAEGLHAWQFFVLAGLGCATAATFMARGQGVVSIILVSVLMAGAAIVGLTALRTVQPLVGEVDDRTEMIGQRTRAALEREKMLVLRSIKELEFDRAMGKLSDEDFKEMGGRLRTRAARLIRQLDAGAGYRQQIEQDLQRIKERTTKDTKGTKDTKASLDTKDVRVSHPDLLTCGACSTANDHDAKFCKACGAKL